MCENAKILCPYCLTREIDPAQAICSVCYSKEDKLERGSWDDLRKRKNTDEIQMFTIAKKVDEAFQVPENKAYACREKHEMIQARLWSGKWRIFTGGAFSVWRRYFPRLIAAASFQLHRIGYLFQECAGLCPSAHCHRTAQRGSGVSAVTDSMEIPIQSADGSGGRTSQLLVRRR